MNILGERVTSADMSSSAMGRLKNTLASSRLGIFDQADARPVQFLSDVSTGIVNFSNASLEYLKVMLRDTSYLHGIDGEGLMHMVHRASRVGERQQSMVFRTVFGSSETMPLRGLSYLLPSIKLAEQIVELGENRRLFPTPPELPEIQFAFMSVASAEANVYYPHADSEKEQFIRVSREYVNRFHPKIADRISFVDDGYFTHNLMNQAGFHRIARTLFDRLPADLGQKLLAMGNSKSSPERSALYAAMHIFVHEGFSPIFDFRVRSGKGIDMNKKFLVSFGGAPEKIFYAIRKTLRSEAENAELFHLLDTAQYITKHTVPPYMLLPQYDLSLEDALTNPDRIYQALNGKGEDGVHTVVRKELQLISNDAGGTEEFVDFLRRMNH